ncbi:MAG: hypothetical protein ABSD89_14580, partial [Halobacteriota archaeon]
MAIPNFWRINEWCKASNGYAMANAQVFFLAQPANTSAFPPTPQVQLYSDPFGLTPISQPLVADGYGFVSAYVAAGTYTMVVALSNVIQNVYADQSYGISSAQVLFETNGVPNPNQGVLNIVGAGDVSVTLNALGQTVVESTGFVIPGTGNGTLVVTANAGVTTAPNGDILTADGLGNAQDSGVLITALTNAVVKNPTGDQTIATNSLLPASANTTQSLGRSVSRWAASLGITDVMSLNGVLNATDLPGADIGAQVNNAITAINVNDATYGGSIYIPAGVYTQTTTIYLPPWITLRGAGAAATVLNFTPTTGWAVVVAGNNTSLFFNFGYQGAIEDLIFVGPGNSHTASGGIYLGGSDGGATSPTTANDPATNQCFGFNLNRCNVQEFAVGLQWGTNSWSQNIMECSIYDNATGVYFPAGIGNLNSGENICIVGGLINNNGTGLLVGSTADEGGVNVTLLSVSLDSNSAWAVQNGTTNNQNAVNMTDCYIYQAQKWIQNYGNMTVKGIYCNGGDSSGTLGYLIDNEGTTYGQLLVMGGVFYNGGTGVVLNPSGKASTWIDAVLTGASGALNGALVPTLIVAGKNIQATALATNFNAGTAWTLFTPSASVGQFFRVNFVQEMTQAASSSSTFPSLTLSWTDAGGISRTA